MHWPRFLSLHPRASYTAIYRGEIVSVRGLDEVRFRTSMAKKGKE